MNQVYFTKTFPILQEKADEKSFFFESSNKKKKQGKRKGGGKKNKRCRFFILIQIERFV